MSKARLVITAVVVEGFEHADLRARVRPLLPAGPIKVGVEAAGHYHRPLLGSGVWPTGWEVLELGPHRSVSSGRSGRRRVKPTRSIWRRSPNWCWLVMGFR